jgi:hypothetical protein
MKKILALLLTLFSLNSFSQAPTIEWANHYDGTAHVHSMIEDVQKTENSEVTNSEEEKTEPSLADKKVMCNRMFGGGDLSAWETAQAECMLQQSESACECMQILTQ